MVSIQVKEGWKCTFARGHMLLARPDRAPQMIELTRLKEGDSVPYDDTDESPDRVPHEKMNLAQRLRAAPDSEPIMRRWDQLRDHLLAGDKSDRPRILFENILEDSEGIRNEAADFIEESNAAIVRMVWTISEGDPDIWPQIWIAKDYSKADLVADLRSILHTPEQTEPIAQETDTLE